MVSARAEADAEAKRAALGSVGRVRREGKGGSGPVWRSRASWAGKAGSGPNWFGLLGLGFSSFFLLFYFYI